MRLLILLVAAGPACSQNQLAREILKELIEINTATSTGDTSPAVKTLEVRFRKAGFSDADIQVFTPAPRKANLVVRLRGSGSERPILFIGHLDVVEALRADWSFDPFQFREEGGYFYGRGTQDMKDDVAIMVTNFLRMKAEGIALRRDFILALTADEELGPDDGIRWLIRHHREAVDAAFCINGDGAGAAISRKGRPLYLGVQAAEKGYASYQLEVTNPGGHSSLPTKDNAINKLADGLARLARFEFPASLNEITRSYFQQMSVIDPGPYPQDMKVVAQAVPEASNSPGWLRAVANLSRSALFNALLRTTCVPTMITGGHAENALPQRATATVNCRILPADNPSDVEATLRRVVADSQIRIHPLAEAMSSPASPVNPAVFDTVRKVAAAMSPSVPVIPVMDTGGSDAVWLRKEGIPTYGLSGVFLDEDDIRAHGRDERVPVEAFYHGLAFTYRVMREWGEVR